jgi:hypothetical protein
VPIYLAWVVKFFAELETQLSAVERIVEYSSLEKEDVGGAAEQSDSRVEGDIVFESAGISHWNDARDRFNET